MKKQDTQAADATAFGDWRRGALRELRVRHKRALEAWTGQNQTGSEINYTSPEGMLLRPPIAMVCDDGDLRDEQDRPRAKPENRTIPHGGFSRAPAGSNSPSHLLTVLDDPKLTARFEDDGPCAVEDAANTKPTQRDLDMADAKVFEQKAAIDEIERAIAALDKRRQEAQAELARRVESIAAAEAAAEAIYGVDWKSKLARAAAVRETGLDPAFPAPKIARQHEEAHRMKLMAAEKRRLEAEARDREAAGWRARGLDGPPEPRRKAGVVAELGPDGRMVARAVGVIDEPETPELTGDFAPTPRMEG